MITSYYSTNTIKACLLYIRVSLPKAKDPVLLRIMDTELKKAHLTMIESEKNLRLTTHRQEISLL